MIYKLVKSGYGSYNELMNTKIDEIMDMYYYDNFTSEYEKEYMERLERKNNNRR